MRLIIFDAGADLRFSRFFTAHVNHRLFLIIAFLQRWYQSPYCTIFTDSFLHTKERSSYEPRSLLYITFSIPAICTFRVLAAMGRRAGVGVVRAVIEGVIPRFGHDCPGATTIQPEGTRLAQAVGAFIRFVHPANLLHEITS